MRVSCRKKQSILLCLVCFHALRYRDPESNGRGRVSIFRCSNVKLAYSNTALVQWFEKPVSLKIWKPYSINQCFCLDCSIYQNASLCAERFCTTSVYQERYRKASSCKRFFLVRRTEGTEKCIALIVPVVLTCIQMIKYQFSTSLNVLSWNHLT